jgi:hypothetical protein
MSGITAWLTGSIWLFCLTYLQHSRLSPSRPSLALLTFPLLGIVMTTLMMLGLGLAGWLNPGAILAFSAAGLFALVATPGPRRALLRTPAAARRAARISRAWWQRLPKWARWFGAGYVGLLSVRFTFLIWALPPFVWDSLSYHLTNIAHWMQVGRIELFESPIVRTYNPANYEVFATWFTTFLHHDGLVEAAGLPAYGLAAAAVYAAARRLGSSPLGAWLGALAYASTPAVILAATGTKNDIHMAAYFLTALALVIELAASSRLGGERDGPACLLLLVVTLALALGTKTYITHLLPGLALVALLLPTARSPISHWRGLLLDARRGVAGLTRSGRVLLAGLLAGALLLASYWNLRNWAVTGNPFYPYEIVIGGQSVLKGPESEFRLSTGELLANLKDLARKFGDGQDPIRPDLPNTTGWGWFAYVMGLPTLAWSLARSRRIRVIAVGFAISFVGLMLSNGPSPWNMRFAIWFPAVFSLGFAEAVDALPGQLPRAARAGLACYFALLLGLNLATTLNYNRISAEEFRAVLALPFSQRHAAALSDNMPAAYPNALELVPNQTALGYNVLGNGFVYPLYRADFSQRIVYVPFTAQDSCEAIASAMAARGTRYLVVAPEHTEDEKIARLRSCAEQATVLRERAIGLYVLRR